MKKASKIDPETIKNGVVIWALFFVGPKGGKWKLGEGPGGLISSRTGGGPLEPPCLHFGAQVGRERREGKVPLILTRFFDP